MSLLRPALIVTGVGLLGYAIYNYFTVQTDLLKNSNYNITDITFSDFTLTTVTLNIGVKFDNNSNINVTIEDMYLDIYMNDKNVGYILQNIQTPILPKNSATIPLTANVNISSAVGDATNILGGLLGIKGGTKDITVIAKGHVSVTSGFVSSTVPVSFTKQMRL